MYTDFYNEGGRPRVTFNDTPRYASSTNQVGNLGFGQMYETGNSHNSEFLSVTDLELLEVLPKL